MIALLRADGHRANEDAEEAVATRHFTEPVCREQRRHGEQRFPVLGDAQRTRARPEGDSPENPADRHTDGDADGDLAHDIPTRPFQHERAVPGLGCHEDGAIDEGEGQAVVEAGFGGEREAHLVVFVDLLGFGVDLFRVGRATDLDIGGEHRVRGRQRAAEQQSRSRGEARGPPAETGHRRDGQRHGDAQQAPGGRPTSPAGLIPPGQWAIQREPDAHECDEHGDLGDMLDDRAVGDRIDRQPVGQRSQPDEHPDDHEHQGWGQGGRPQ